MGLTQRLLVWGTDFTLASGISYGPEPRQRLDVYTPRRGPPKATVLFFYGGSWKSGSRSLYRFLGQAFASRGYQLVVADYGLYPLVRYPGFIEDAASAFAWTRRNIAAHGGDGDRLFVMGHSAGGYNAAMIMLDPHWLDGSGPSAGMARGVILLAAPLSFNPLKTDSIKDIFSGVEDIDTARPIKLAARGAAAMPPVLLLHGTADDTVGDWNSRNFAQAVNEAGGRASLMLYENVSHLGVITCFAWPLRWRAPCLDDVTRFMEESLKQEFHQREVNEAG